MTQPGALYLGVVNVYDPATGWATAPVAAAAWTTAAAVAWSWLPASYDARQLRADVDRLDPAGQARWLTGHSEDPAVGVAVDIVHTKPPTALEQPAQIALAVEGLLDEIMIGLG